MRASEGLNPCTRPSFATKNVFDVLQDLSESIRGSPGPQLDAADGQPEPIVHDLHQSLVELLERPEVLSLHAVRRVGRERQLHLKVRALCGEVEKVFDVLVDTGAQVSLVKAGLLPPECLTDSRKPVRLKVANGQYMVGGTKEAAIGLQFGNHGTKAQAPREGNPTDRHANDLPDPPAREARPSPHSTDPASHPHLTAPPSHQPATLRPALRTTTQARLTSTDPPRHHARPRHTAPQRATVQCATARRDATRHRATQHDTTDPNLRD